VLSARLYTYPYDATNNIETIKPFADELNLTELEVVL
jgi:hypothetical protein